MATGGGTFTWKRSEGDDSDDDVWDDRMLIDAYEKASQQVSTALRREKTPVHANRGKQGRHSQNAIDSTESSGQESKQKNRKGKSTGCTSVWRSGQYCRCVYHEDGLIYEGQIIKLLSHRGACVVRYIGYNNEEEQNLSSLKKSHGKEARDKQIEEAELVEPELEDISAHDTMEAGQPGELVTAPLEGDGHCQEPSNSRKRIGMIPPPPPSIFPDKSDLADDEVLSSMLMSWYMSGYHTGYYKAHKQFKMHCKCKAGEEC